MTDESNIGVWFGLICVALTLLPWIPLDAWLQRHRHEYITTEFRELLTNGGWIALIAMFFIGGMLAVAAYHFFWQRG